MTLTSGFIAVSAALGAVDLAHPDAIECVQDLSLEVGGVDHVHVDDADRAHAGGG
jgi:hypothetical protein